MPGAPCRIEKEKDFSTWQLAERNPDIKKEKEVIDVYFTSL